MLLFPHDYAHSCDLILFSLSKSSLSVYFFGSLSSSLVAPILCGACLHVQALVARRDDVSLQTRDTMGVLCTCVRAGWALTTALLCVGVEPTTRHLPQLLLHWRAAVGNQPPNPPPTTTTTTSSSRTGGHHHHADAHLQGRSSAFEPTHELVCLDAALNCILG